MFNTRVVDTHAIADAMEELFAWYSAHEDKLAATAAMAVFVKAYEAAGGFPQGTGVLDRMAEIFTPIFVPATKYGA